MRFVNIVCICILFVSFGSYSNSILRQDTSSNKIHILPEHYIDADVGAFLLQKNDVFTKNYLMEANIDLGYDFISFLGKFHSVWDFTFKIGVGKQFENVVFDPRWLAIGMTPSLEYRLNSCIVQVGLDRRCWHDVDRNPEQPTVYWTQPFLLVGSSNMRNSIFNGAIFSNKNIEQKDRFSWSVKAAYFTSYFFGYPPDLASGGHDYTSAFTGKARYVFSRYGIWAAGLDNTLDVYSDKGGKSFASNTIELDNMIHGETLDVMIFFSYNLFDQKKSLKNMNKDRLAQLGLRFSL